MLQNIKFDFKIIKEFEHLFKKMEEYDKEKKV